MSSEDEASGKGDAEGDDQAIVRRDGADHLGPIRTWHPPNAVPRWRQPRFIALLAVNFVFAGLWLYVLVGWMGLGAG